MSTTKPLQDTSAPAPLPNVGDAPTTLADLQRQIDGPAKSWLDVFGKPAQPTQEGQPDAR